MKAYNKAYWKKTKTEQTRKHRKWYLENRNERLQYAKRYRKQTDNAKRISVYLKKWRANRAKENRQFLNTYLTEHPCIVCGETDVRVLDFDHVRGKKCFNVTTGLYCNSVPRLLKEIAKCDIRCANCHRKRHKGQ